MSRLILAAVLAACSPSGPVPSDAAASDRTAAVAMPVEHSARVNQSVIAAPADDPRQPFRRIEVLWMSPTRPFHDIAREFADRIPPAERERIRRRAAQVRASLGATAAGTA